MTAELPNNKRTIVSNEFRKWLTREIHIMIYEPIFKQSEKTTGNLLQQKLRLTVSRRIDSVEKHKKMTKA